MEFFSDKVGLRHEFLAQEISTETFNERMDLLRAAERRMGLLMKTLSWAKSHSIDPSEFGIQLEPIREDEIKEWFADPRTARKTISQDTLRIKKSFDAMRKMHM